MAYSKQGFTDNTWVLKAEHLVKMEDAIIANQNNISNISPATSPIPSYWQSYLDSKVKEINTLADSLGGSADCFIFIADQHRNTGAGNEAYLINYIVENTSVKKVFFGGDIVQGSSSDKQIFRDYQKAFSRETTIFPMRGNHDTWGNSKEQDFWDTWVRPLEGKASISDKLWYYYDNTIHKIRYIVTDSIYSSSDGTNNLTSPEQIAWMQDRIKELDSDWTVLIFHHGIWTASKTATMPINNDGQLMLDSLDAVYDEAKCSIAGYWVAHCHRDYLLTADKGYIAVGTTLDCYSGGQSSYDVNFKHTKGTTTEHAFDVVFFVPSTRTIKTIRIGAGNNREFTYLDKNTDLSVQSVSLPASAFVRPNAEITLKATINPTYASNKNVTWSVLSGEDKLNITPNGLECVIKGVAEGSAVIQVVTEDGNFASTCTISVTTSNSVDITAEFEPWTPGTCTYSTGATQTSDTNWLFSNLVDVSDYSSLTFTQAQTSTANTSLGYAFYDANKTSIGKGASNGGVDYVPVEKTLTIPDNAKYFRTMWMNDTHAKYNADINNINKFYCYGNL